MFFQSAISVFISNITVLAIENCLIKDLSSIFSPSFTANMDDDQLHNIAVESEDVRVERSSLRQRLDVLHKGRQILYEHMGMIVVTVPTLYLADPPRSKSSSNAHDRNGTHRIREKDIHINAKG